MIGEVTLHKNIMQAKVDLVYPDKQAYEKRRD